MPPPTATHGLAADCNFLFFVPTANDILPLQMAFIFKTQKKKTNDNLNNFRAIVTSQVLRLDRKWKTLVKIEGECQAPPS
jgi:hypothetical protein